MADPTPPTTPNARLAAALSYAKAGWPVLPLQSSGDAPMVGVSSVDTATLVSHWSKWPLANVGVALGIPAGVAIGICCLVVDFSKQAEEYLKRHGVLDKIGAGHIISRNERAWLFVCQRPVANREIATGVRLLGDGVLTMPPSTLADSTEFKWRKGEHLVDKPLSMVPRWLLLAAEEPTATDAPVLEVNNDWIRDLIMTPKGEVKNTFANLCTIFRCAPKYAGKLLYDEMRLTPTLLRVPLLDPHVGAIREDLERAFGIAPAGAAVREAILTVSYERRFHPVREYLQSLKWDGVQRINRVAAEVLGIAPEALTQRMLRLFFISAVARAMSHGCKVDTALVLVGPQSAGKSTFFDTLGGAWFSDTRMDIANKDSLQQISSAWIYEWGEIENVTGKKQSGEVKMFVTSKVDNFRPPYEHSVRPVPRMAVIVGSTNKDRFLNDESGSRRFWVLRVFRKLDVALLKSWRDQLWAEALDAFTQGEQWWLTDAEDAVREQLADEFQEEDPWENEVQRWMVIPTNFRGDYTSNEILTGALRLERSEMGQATMNRIARVMRRLGLGHKKVRIERGNTVQAPAWAWVWPTDGSAPEWLHPTLEDIAKQEAQFPTAN